MVAITIDYDESDSYDLEVVFLVAECLSIERFTQNAHETYDCAKYVKRS